MKKNEKHSILLNGLQINMVINRKKIKNTYIRIDEFQQIIVNTNTLTPINYIYDLVYKHQNQIMKQIENKQKKDLPENVVMFLGKPYQVQYISSNVFAYNMTSDTILIYTNKEHKTALDQFYREMAEQIFMRELNQAFHFFKVNYKLNFPDLEIRKMKTRYGTCYYTRNKICLNLYLIKHDVECINYVINHELCHFIHHDHSRDFYHLLGTIVKNHKELRKKLFNL